ITWCIEAKPGQIDAHTVEHPESIIHRMLCRIAQEADSLSAAINVVGHEGLGDEVPIHKLEERGGDILLPPEKRAVLPDAKIRPGNLLEVDIRIIELRGGTSRRRLGGGAVGVVPKLHKIGRLRIERESFKDQTDPSHVELAHVLLKLPGRNGHAGDCGIVFGVANSAVGTIHAAFCIPELKSNADLQLKLVLELR